MKHIKPISLVIAVILLVSNKAFADICLSEYCPSVHKNVNGVISSTLSKVSGAQWFITSILESQIKSQLDKEMSANFNVNVIPFGGKSLLEGKFKSFTAYAPSGSIEGFYFTDLNFRTLCDYNHFVYKKGKVYTNENFLLEFSANMTSEDLQQLLNSSEYTKFLRSMNVSIGKVSLLRVSEPKAELVNNRLLFSIKIRSPLTFGEPLRVYTDMGLTVEDGKLVFTDVKMYPNSSSLNINSLLPVINKLNPFVYKASLFNSPDSQVKLSDFKIENNKIYVKGLVIVKKNYYNN